MLGSSRPGWHRQGLYSSSPRCCPGMLLGSPVSEELEQVVGGSDQIPFAAGLLQAPQQEASQSPVALDLAVHRLHDHFAVGIDLGSLRAPELVGHASFRIGISG